MFKCKWRLINISLTCLLFSSFLVPLWFWWVTITHKERRETVINEQRFDFVDGCSFWLGNSDAKILVQSKNPWTRKIIYNWLWFSSEITKTIATTAFFVIIWLIMRRHLCDSTRTWRGGSRGKIQISPIILSHEVIENRPTSSSTSLEFPDSVIVADLYIVVLVFTTSFLQEYAAENPILHWNHRALQRMETNLA